jgi:hypothetical protein
MEDLMRKVCSTSGAKKSSYRILMGNPDGDRDKKDLEADGRLILGDMNWFDLTRS